VANNSLACVSFADNIVVYSVQKRFLLELLYRTSILLDENDNNVRVIWTKCTIYRTSIMYPIGLWKGDVVTIADYRIKCDKTVDCSLK